MSTLTLTATPRTVTEARVRVVRDRAISRIAELRSQPPIDLRPLPPRGAVARVAIVQSAACLAAGDEVAIDVRVEAGARLELTEISATIAHRVDDPGAPIVQYQRATVGHGAALVWLGQPVIIAGGSVVGRRCVFDLGADSRALIGETLVLGRSGEPPGAIRSRLRVRRNGTPVLDEELDTSDPTCWGSAAVAGGARVLGSVLLLGIAAPPPAAPTPHCASFALGPMDTVLRGLHDDTIESELALEPVRSAWRRLVADTA